MELENIKGVGPKKKKLLNDLGVFSVSDLLFFYPKKYEDRRELKQVNTLNDEEYAYVELEILDKARTSFYGRNKSTTRVRGKDRSGELNLIWYNQRFQAQKLECGNLYKFYGKFSKKTRALLNPIHCKIEDDLIGKISPIYPRIKGISNNDLLKFIKSAYDLTIKEVPEILDEEIKKKFSIADLSDNYFQIHSPENFDKLEKSIRDIQIRDLLIRKLAVNILKQAPENPIVFKKCDYRRFLKKLPYTLSEGQKKVLDEIYADMTSKIQMNRLLEGDVGSGKTIVAIISALIAINSKYQVAFMAPTEILTIQHYEKNRKFLNEFGINIGLLTGSISPSDKREIRGKLARGEIDLCFGTHSLIQDSVEFKNLGLVITDEQHRFGVNQRKLISDKGENVDTLVLSATPIPRTLALSIYGDLSISEIKEYPKGRKEIDTFALTYRYENRVLNFIKKQIDDGGQVYVVCPAIDEDSEKANVEKVYRKYKKNFSKYRVSYLHGKLKEGEKNSTMRDFAGGKINILIATTVIEVGIDVKNANLMVIYDANNFGLSQLHQLRGRVGRGMRKSYCILLADQDKNFERLKFLETNNNGFKIAKKDLEYRGIGQIFGTAQHGNIPENLSNFSLREETILEADNIAKLYYKDKKFWNRELSKKVNQEVDKFKEYILN